MELSFINYERDELPTVREKLYKFMYSLEDEKLTFALSLDQMISAECLFVVQDETGRWLGCSGFRSKWGMGIFFLVIHRDIQRRGKGRALTEKAIAHWPTWKPLLLNVTRGNHRARNLYEDMGFMVVHRTKVDVTMIYKTWLSKLLWPVFKLLMWVTRGR